jgi:multidrug efflux system membrane fusion protein
VKSPRLGFVPLGLVLVGLMAWTVLAGHKPMEQRKAAPVSVSVAQATVQDVPLSIGALGAVLPWQGVTIHAQVSGRLLKAPFREGAYVKAGDLLAEIDPAPYQAVLMQAQGALRRDQALLEEAQVDLKRYQILAAQDSLPRQQLDQQAALVKQDEGVVLVDQGVVAAAEVNLRYCRIRSPITGRVGVRLVDPGNIVSTSDTTGIVIVNQITPIAVTFTVPQGDFQRLSDVSNGFNRPLLTAALSQETGAELGTGELGIADNKVDPSTGTVEMKARFPNDGHALWPGQFVNVRLTLQTLPQATVIPAAAVNQGPKGPFAYVIGADNRATMHPLVIAATQDALAIVKSGVRPGERVVVDGQLSLKPGAPVNIHGSGGGSAGRGGGDGGAKGAGRKTAA